MRAGRTILVVDDEDRLRQALRRMLTRAGYVVTLAHDAASALVAARSSAFGAAIIDQNLSGTAVDRQGLALAEQIRAARLAGRVVLFTGYGSTDAAFHAGKIGACAYLTKPASKEQILAAIAGTPRPFASQPTLERVVRDHCARVVAACDDELATAAEVRGIHRNTLARILGRPAPTR